ncbi:MAG: acyl carrier protein [Gammaproteobacteria bacterium]|nr:acyl carrier protein [Gammaproteobacteria bacterium]
MSSVDLLERLKTVVTSITQETYESVEANAQLSLDSIQRISLIVAFEEEFDIEIDSEELEPETFDSFEQMATYVQSCIA